MRRREQGAGSDAGLFLALTHGDAVAALQAYFASVVPAERVEAMAREELRARIGSVSLEWLRAEWELPNVRAVRAKLRKLGVAIRYLGRTERVLVSDLEALLAASGAKVRDASAPADGGKIVRLSDAGPADGSAPPGQEAGAERRERVRRTSSTSAA